MSLDYLDSSLGDADGLLLHGFVDGHLIFNVHLVKLVDAAHTLPRDRRASAPQTRRPTRCSLPALTLSASIRAPASITNSWDSSSRTTAAVRPAALLAFPLVYTALGLNSSTCLRHTHLHISICKLGRLHVGLWEPSAVHTSGTGSWPYWDLQQHRR